MRSIGQIGIGATLGLLSLACSDKLLVDRTGTGGVAGTGGVMTGEGSGNSGRGGSGGTSGSGGRGGAAGEPGGAGGTGGSYTDLELPACVKALVAACATDGTCTNARTDAGEVSDYCFASGVRASFSGGFTGTTGSKVMRVTKADGSPCYSFETALAGGEILQYTWKDAAGQVVATGSNDPFSIPSHKIMCADGSETKTCQNSTIKPTNACCDLAAFGNATCVGPVVCGNGTCP